MDRVRLKRRLWIGGLAALLATGAVLSGAGKFLVVDTPRPSDVILVLAGETNRRPEAALRLLRAGYGRRMIIDVPAGAMVYGFTQLELAQKYIQDLPQAAAISVCPIEGLSTRDESKDAEKCLARSGDSSVLIVTSDFHTRRARDVFEREIPGRTFAVAAARDDTQFGTRWWTHRQWAKTFVDEWLRLLWWKVVDRWR